MTLHHMDYVRFSISLIDFILLRVLHAVYIFICIQANILPILNNLGFVCPLHLRGKAWIWKSAQGHPCTWILLTANQVHCTHDQGSNYHSRSVKHSKAIWPMTQLFLFCTFPSWCVVFIVPMQLNSKWLWGSLKVSGSGGKAGFDACGTGALLNSC